MNWTKEKPTQPGWYWYKPNKKGLRVEFVEIFRTNAGLMVVFPGDPHLSSLDNLIGQWYGPLEAPEEPT